MKYDRFDAPAFLDEFPSDAKRKEWSNRVSSYFRRGTDYNERFADVAPQFYDPVKSETAEPFETPTIEWPGFPKLVKDKFPGNPVEAWKTAETGANARARYMDEYLEWHVLRNGAGKITRVSFTCETAAYYEFLAGADPNRLLAIYKDLVDPARKNEVKLSDLVDAGTYKPRSKWNTTYGAVHLIQQNNTLPAEIYIGAQACILRKRANGTKVTAADELIKCGEYGAPGRASDPLIGATVNELARAGYSISFRNPVALYITRWSSQGWKKPDGKPVGNYWKLVRGQAGAANKPSMGLHLVYEVPAAEGFVVGDIKIGNRNIEYGGQIAENVSVGLFALICNEGQANNPAFVCGEHFEELAVADAQLAAAAEEDRELFTSRYPGPQDDDENES